jgi:mRNA-degrading endonuclease RelE of RelBE toxin-antitoxin system
MIKIVIIFLGIIAILIVLCAIIGDITFSKRVENEVKELFKENRETKPEIITEEEIEGLPEPVQRYLKYTQIIGKEKINTVRLKQGGYFRMNEDQKWMPVEAEQYFNVDSIEFIWVAKVDYAPLLSIYAKDEFVDGKGNLVVKLLGIIKVVDAKGYEIDNGEILRFLAESVWFPSAFLNDYIEWEAIDNESAKAIITYQGISASAIFHFNEKGEVTSITAKRYREVDGNFVLEDWEGQIIEYKMFNGVNVPSRVDIIWKLKTGDFCYDRIELTDIEYGNSSVY